MEDNNMMLPLEGSAGYEEKTTGTNTGSSEVEYNEDNIRHLDDMEHIRVRSGMYIGRLGDGSQNDDGIYVLLKEVMDNSIDEFQDGCRQTYRSQHRRKSPRKRTRLRTRHSARKAGRGSQQTEYRR